MTMMMSVVPPRFSFTGSRGWLLALLSIVCAVGMWTYVGRVLIPHQVSDAAAHDRPRGNLSDLYPRWLGARELLLHGRDPYGKEVSREIQAGYYGRPIDPSRPNDPRDEQGFAYPVYVVFCVAPTIGLPFAVVQRAFFWILLILTSASVLLWLRVWRWSAPPSTQVSLLALTLGSVAAMQGLKLQQISLLVAGLLAIAIVLLESDRAVTAGILLAVASIKPQLVLLVLCWLAIWTVGDWRRRYRWLVSYLATMAISIVASEWYLPHWIPRFWQATRNYQHYTGAMSVLDAMIGPPSIHAPWSWILELLTLAALLAACWRERRQAANTDSFAFTLSLTLATTILLVPTLAQYNQVLLIPALLWLVKERQSIWRRSMVNRILLVMTIGLILWPWISSTALAGLSFVLPQETVERAWVIPLWTAPQTPVAVAALMLAHYYRTTFPASARPGAS
jgi:hypothetical protein